MKRPIRPFAILLATALTLCAAEPSADARNAVLEAEGKWKQAVLKADRSTLEQLLSPELSYTHSSAKTQTKDQFIEDVASRATVYKSIGFENTKLRQYGPVVVVTQSANIVTVQTGAARLYLTEVWAQEGGQWQMVSRQATKLP